MECSSSYANEIIYKLSFQADFKFKCNFKLKANFKVKLRQEEWGNMKRRLQNEE